MDLFFLLREKIVRLEKKKETTDCILISVVKYTYDVWQRLPTVPDRPWTIGWSPWRIRARPWFFPRFCGGKKVVFSILVQDTLKHIAT